MVTCPSGFYGNNYQCVSCDASCKHCKGPLATNCTSCKDGLVRADNGTGLCLDNCPSGENLNLLHQCRPPETDDKFSVV